jgi:hypothetical protein
VPSVGGTLNAVRAVGVFLLWLTAGWSLNGCVQQAVLENDVRSAQWKARVLATQNDLDLAEAALSAELVELEALYQRAPSDARVAGLLARDYWLLADGFVEAHRLDAVVAGNQVEATRQEGRQTAARARRSYYAKLVPSAPAAAADTSPSFGGAWLLERPRAACAAHDRKSYERELNEVLRARESQPEERLGLTLAQRLAQSWLEPGVSAACRF